MKYVDNRNKTNLKATAVPNLHLETGKYYCKLPMLSYMIIIYHNISIILFVHILLFVEYYIGEDVLQDKPVRKEPIQESTVSSKDIFYLNIL